MICAPLTLERFLKADYLRGRWLDPKTHQQMEISVRLLDRWARETGRTAPVPMHDLSRDLIIDWMIWLRDEMHRAPKTINNKRGDVLTLWREANNQGKCGPAESVRKVPEPTRVPIAWKLSEINLIFDGCNQVDGLWEDVRASLCWKIAFLLFWDMGGRLAEVFDAELSHLRLEDSSLFVPAEHRKGKRSDKMYALHPQTVAMIKASLPSQRTRIVPFPFRRRQVWPHLKKLLRSVGLPDDRLHMFHCMRRSAESYAANAKDAQWAADAIGHTVAVARKHYISPEIAPGPRLIDVLPRPDVAGKSAQRTLF